MQLCTMCQSPLHNQIYNQPAQATPWFHHTKSSMITINILLTPYNSNQHTLLHQKISNQSQRSLAKNGIPMELEKTFSLHFHQVGGKALTHKRNLNILYRDEKCAGISMSHTAALFHSPLMPKRLPDLFKYPSALRTFQPQSSLAQYCSVKLIHYVKISQKSVQGLINETPQSRLISKSRHIQRQSKRQIMKDTKNTRRPLRYMIAKYPYLKSGKIVEA